MISVEYQHHERKPPRNRIMLNDFDAVNRILSEMAELNIVEPIDDPSIQTDFYDYAEVVGIDIDDFVPPEYDHA